MSAVPNPEAAIVALVGAAYSGAASAAPVASAPAMEVSKFEFDPEFQTKIATHVMRDLEFMRKVGHLIDPGYFENVGEAAIVNIAVRFYRKFNTLPNRVAAQQLLKDDLIAKIIRGDIRPAVIEAFKAVFVLTPDLGNADFFAEKVAEFAQHQAVSNAIYNSVDLLGAKNFEKIRTAMTAALAVGINIDGEEYDYWERIDERTQVRQDRASGLLPPQGITTGFLKMDELLYHRGWGKKELSMLLGGPKSGKTAALIAFAKSASLAGKNVLYVTLEVANGILSDRFDASISDTMMKALATNIHDVKAKVKAMHARAGALKLHEYPSGTFTPSMLRHLIERYKSPAIMPDGSIREPIKFDMVVVDYMDIMAPDTMVDEARENSKAIGLALRAIAFTEDVAMLTATQGNREGAQAAVMKATHVADDYNKVRTVDLLISINITDEERAAGEARLYFAASRNQESGFTIFIKQEIAKMKFISQILRIE